MSKIITCLGCSSKFTARKDAKTCSVRCRKRLQRNKQALALEITGLKDFRSYIELTERVSYEPVRLAKTALKRKPTSGKWKNLLILLILPFFSLSSHQAKALTEGYITYDSGLKQGMIVSLSPSSTSSQKVVQRADYTDADKVLGITVSITDSILTVANPSSKVYIATSGQSQAYVSDINGTVKKGDTLSLSPLAGILMKNTDPSQGIAGVSLADFPANVQTVEAKNASDKQVSSKVALMPININLVAPAAISSQSWLSTLGRALTGHSVAPVRVLASLAIFTTLLVVEGSIIYGAISKSLVAIGRNPLASRLVAWQAVRSFGMALLILAIGGSVISIILWL